MFGTDMKHIKENAYTSDESPLESCGMNVLWNRGVTPLKVKYKLQKDVGALLFLKVCCQS